MTVFYACETECENGRVLTQSIHATKAGATRLISSNERVRRRTFVPLATDARYRTVPIYWFPDWRQPTAPLDLPPECEGGCESVEGEPELLDRESALCEVVEWNRQYMQGEALYERWLAIVETGEPSPTGLVSLTLAKNGVGVTTHYREYPVRVVRPTAAELKRFS